MSEAKKVATSQEAANYIETALISGHLVMKDACKELGWSFPRTRSKAQTICKKLGGTFIKKERGVYYLNPNDSTPKEIQTPEETITTAAVVDPPDEQEIAPAPGAPVNIE